MDGDSDSDLGSRTPGAKLRRIGDIGADLMGREHLVQCGACLEMTSDAKKLGGIWLCRKMPCYAGVRAKHRALSKTTGGIARVNEDKKLMSTNVAQWREESKDWFAEGGSVAREEALHGLRFEHTVEEGNKEYERDEEKKKKKWFNKKHYKKHVLVLGRSS